MRKFDTCVGREARINKLMLKKPPGLMSASGASLDEPLRAMKEKKWEGPLIIDQVLTGGAYRLRDASNNRLEPNPWNATRHRRFYA